MSARSDLEKRSSEWALFLDALSENATALAVIQEKFGG